MVCGGGVYMMGMGMVVYMCVCVCVCARACKSALFLVDLPGMHGYPLSVCVCDGVCVCVTVCV